MFWMQATSLLLNPVTVTVSLLAQDRKHRDASLDFLPILMGSLFSA